ncbi:MULTISPECIES: hypothetical protein [Burkholderiaceae]|jgi:hypothetical protein|uniref:Uncharacterized protein n=1 Tax=Burkholderia aenigmatica TaxID=2015348 RepID=A0A6J5JHK3_9BURK|nr:MULTISPECIES: hypothetical protein [Burkholderiaceae]KAB0601817.1 hypothetical protein F7R19_15060 [Cupriavidus pauculus]MBR8501501.1 hypothetical protein [Burkholderia cenocepacia]MCO8552937.1 hypothetical protein [Burkholderia multivorans]UAL00247.1 hypothetical protein K8O84_02400 [Cupriavidus pauculus]CAB3970785.1 hypothetical protein BLA3211_06118 [Burkholderia aenigmatica]
MDEKSIIVRVPSSFFKHMKKVSAKENTSIREITVSALLKELKALNQEYASPEDFKFRRFCNIQDKTKGDNNDE